VTVRALNRYNAWAAIRKRAQAAGFLTRVGCQTWRATGITIHLENKGRLEHAPQMAGHESPRTTKLYDRTKDEIKLSEVERWSESGCENSFPGLNTMPAAAGSRFESSLYRTPLGMFCALCFCSPAAHADRLAFAVQSPPRPCAFQQSPLSDPFCSRGMQPLSKLEQLMPRPSQIGSREDRARTLSRS
jgi:hypothetical protein